MSRIQRHMMQRKEECAEVRYMEKELKTVDRYIPKQKRAFLCHIGHDLHGHFDPNHIDFELLCGMIHTDRAAPFLPPIIGLLIFLTLIMFIVIELYYFLPLVLINLPFLILLFFAIKRRSHRLMLPFLIYAILEKIVWLVTILFLTITVFNPHLPGYELLKYICDTDWLELQLAVLLIVLIFSIDLFIMLYLDYNVLFHYIYLMHLNTESCKHTSDCPGRGHVDPLWHGKNIEKDDCGGQCPHSIINKINNNNTVKII